MSGAGGHGGGQLYGNRQTASGSVPVYAGDDVGGVLFQSPACGVGGDAGGGLTPPYSSITDYLQGFLDPAELARQLDAPPAERDQSAVGDVIGHDGQVQRAPITPNSSMSSEPPMGRKGRPAPEEGDEEGEIDEERSADHHNSR
jgi:hypothetical protein